MLVETALVLIVGGEVEEQLLRLELLTRNKGCRRRHSRDLTYHRSQSTPVGSVRHRRHSISTCDYIVAHGRRGFGGRDEGLLLENLPNGLRGVDHYPVIPAHADSEDIAIFLRPAAENSRRVGR